MPRRRFGAVSAPYIFILCAVIVVCASQVPLSSDYGALPTEMRSAPVAPGPIKSLEWDPVRRHLDLEALTEPVIVRNSDVNNMRAMSWTPESLSRRDEMLNNVQQLVHPVLLYTNMDKPLAKLRGFKLNRRAQPAARLRLSLPQLFERIHAGEEKGQSSYLYYSSNIDNLDADLREDVAPLATMMGENGVVNTNLWIGAEGVTTDTHYDSFHNVFVQVHGSKTFWLWPPTSHVALHLFPRTHPSFRTAQVDFDDVDETAFPRFRDAIPMHVQLNAGDVLYLPPYWFHRVRARSASISLNTWFFSKEYNVSDLILTAPVPFDESWDAATMTHATQVYIRSLVDALAALEDERIIDSVRNTIPLLIERYGSLKDLLPAFTAREWPYCAPGYSDTVLVERLKAETARGIIQLVPLFQQLPVGIRALHLANYIEDLLQYFVGVEHAYHFLRTCLS